MECACVCLCVGVCVYIYTCVSCCLFSRLASLLKGTASGGETKESHLLVEFSSTQDPCGNSHCPADYTET